MPAFNNWSFWTALSVFSHKWKAVSSRGIWTILPRNFTSWPAEFGKNFPRKTGPWTGEWILSVGCWWLCVFETKNSIPKVCCLLSVWRLLCEATVVMTSIVAPPTVELACPLPSEIVWRYMCSLLCLVQCESKKIPLPFSDNFFPNGWEFLIFNQFFTHLLYVPFYTRWQICIQLFPTLTKLCHNKRDHPTKFYISLER